MKIFTEGRIASLDLKNRIIRAGCFEGMSQNGEVTPQLIEHHRRVAAGGVAMTTVSYCSVSYDGRTFEHELWMRESILPGLKKLTETIHREGAKASIQLGHSGYFTSKKVIGKRPMGASPRFCVYCRSFGRAMNRNDIKEKIDDFASAALMAREAGFDAVEIHAGHGYLLSQFLSPWTNKRKDEYGGTLENRMRFPVEVIRKMKKAVGKDFPVLVKMNQRDGMQGGLEQEEAVHIAKAFENAGADALIPSAGFTSKVPFLMLRGNLPVEEMARNRKSYFDKIGIKLFGKLMVPEHPWEPMFLSEGASEIAKAVNIPVIFIGGLQTGEDIGKALEMGASFVQVGRATIQDPDFVNKLRSGEITASPCDHCNRCVAAMDAGGVYCVSNEKGFLG
jgi:2,4-dienoyl-CoA reductase-like NADH-dependent reductase (Old Yellow Enzyme family)